MIRHQLYVFYSFRNYESKVHKTHTLVLLKTQSQLLWYCCQTGMLTYYLYLTVHMHLPSMGLLQAFPAIMCIASTVIHNLRLEDNCGCWSFRYLPPFVSDKASHWLQLCQGG